MSLDKLLHDRYGLTKKSPADFDVNTTLENILSRSSCRSYSNKLLPQSHLETLLSVAFSAPSKSDLQQTCVIQIQDAECRRQLVQVIPSIEWTLRAPHFMVWCGDSRRIRRLAEEKNREFANDHLDAFMNAAVDTGIAMQTFIIAAESMGLGCCPVSEVRNQVQLLSDLMELPKHVFPVAGLCVGWPDQSGKISLRLPNQVTVMKDRYDDRKMQQYVEEYDRRREALEQTLPDQQRLVERFGVSDHYGWSENRTRQYAVPQRTDFGAYIRKQGFNLE